MNPAPEVPVLRRLVAGVGPLVQVVAVYLLVAGHNAPGGGFVAGLVLAAGLAMRGLVGRRLPAALGRRLVAAGLGLAGLVAAAPVVAGRALLDQATGSVVLPVFGTVKAGTSLLFDVGVVLVVAGLAVVVLDVLAEEGTA